MTFHRGRLPQHHQRSHSQKRESLSRGWLLACLAGVLWAAGCASGTPAGGGTGGTQPAGGSGTAGAATGGSTSNPQTTGGGVTGGSVTGGSTSNPQTTGGGVTGGSVTGGTATAGTTEVTGGSSTGGESSTGGRAAGGEATGGSSTAGNTTASSATGGSSAGGRATGGSATGGSVLGGSAIGGSATGGSGTGGRATGGSTTGGSGTGGKASGGVATGGTASGGTILGGTSAAGAVTGGTTGSAGTTSSGALAATPPMGWNSWNKFGGSITDTLVRGIADAMVSTGMQAAGYQFINIDDMWQASSRDSSGNIVPDGTKFPNGMKALADYVHGKGLKLGLYSDRGTQTCAGRPGSYGHETQDAQTYASWGADYLKYDNCSPAAGSNITTDYTNMSNALKSSGRPIVFSLCAWWFYTWETPIGQLWRTTTDIKDTWASFTANLDANGGWTPRYSDANYGSPGIAQYASPGHWNDPDMLEVGNGGMTDTEYQSHFSLWAIMAAPLIAGNDIRSMTASTKSILTNADVIAVDQDPLGVQGKPISTSTTLEVWSKKLSGNQTYAVVLFNRTAASASITVTWASLGMTSTSATVRDLWSHTDLGPTATQYTATVPSHGVAMLKVVGS
jgi:Alpha galactosidase A/Alpha galactosidase C-terminal beta sandwich domain